MPDRHVRRASIGALALLALVAAPAAAQELGLGVAHGTTSKATLPGGPGLTGWVLFQSLPLRLQASLTREWGQASHAATLCSIYWPEPSECRREETRRYRTTTSAEASALLVSPRVFGLRLAAGLSYGLHAFDIGREGLESGRHEAPVMEDTTRPGRGWLVTLEHDAFLATGLTLRAGLHAFGIDFGGCVLDTWAECGRQTFRRFTLGLGYSLR